MYSKSVLKKILVYNWGTLRTDVKKRDVFGEGGIEDPNKATFVLLKINHWMTTLLVSCFLSILLTSGKASGDSNT